MATLRFRPLFHTELAFQALATLDLRNDAANIFGGRKKAWSNELESAYLAAPGRLLLHGLPLIAGDLDALLHMLREGRFRDVQDSAGMKLAATFADALEGEASGEREAWDREAGARLEREKTLAPWLADLEKVFASLWSESPPTVEVHDCPALAHREGTHGRSILWAGTLHVAVGLGGPLEQVLCQLVHEAVHVVTDPPIRKAHSGLHQDTRADTAAFALHRALEKAAVERGAELMVERAPRLVKGYDIWRRRHGC